MAETVLKQEMDRLIYTNPSTFEPDTLVACADDYSPGRTFALADYAVVGWHQKGDTAQALVQFTAVAEEEPSAHAADVFDARLGIVVDTLHETLVRSPSGLWKICDSPEQDFMGFAHEGNDAQTNWTPHGASWKDVPALVDSVRAARHRP